MNLTVSVSAEKVILVVYIFLIHADYQIIVGIVSTGSKAGIMFRKRNIVIAEDMAGTPMDTAADCIPLSRRRINVKISIPPRLMNKMFHNHFGHG
jgi:hypothetical protein